MLRTKRFYEGLGLVDEILANAVFVSGAKVHSGTIPAGDERYPGDGGDRLIWAFRVEPRTLNRISSDNDIYSGWITVPNIHEPLLVYDFDELKLKPHLAENYRVSDDGLEVTFRLRDDIYFSDGEMVTADDVIFTYETILNPEMDAANLAELYEDVDRVVKVDERMVKFYMKRPYVRAPEILAFWDVGIYPEHIYGFDDAKEFNSRHTNPVGSGPYLFEKWDVGREIVLRRNENYWAPKPKLEKVIYKFIPNTVAAIQALRSHKVDIVIPEPEQFVDLAGEKGFTKEFRCLSYWSPGVPFFFIGWNQETLLFGDKKVRLAMTHLVNRRQIVERLLEGCGEVTSGPFFIKGGRGNTDIESWPYDLQEAKKLLEEAGWIDSDGDGLRDKRGVPFRFRLMYSASSTLYNRVVKLVKDDAARAGVEVIAEPLEWSIVAGKLGERDFEAVLMGWTGGIVEDFYRIFHSSQIAGRGSNYVGFRNSEADALMEEIRVTLEEGQMTRLCRRLHQILHEQQPYTFLFTRPALRLVDRRFKNANVHRLGLNYLEWYVPRDEQRYK
jgi:peptide/nickel transport system substrate-binding protein